MTVVSLVLLDPLVHKFSWLGLFLPRTSRGLSFPGSDDRLYPPEDRSSALFKADSRGLNH